MGIPPLMDLGGFDKACRIEKDVYLSLIIEFLDK